MKLIDHLFEDCERCGGTGDNMIVFPWTEGTVGPCPDCTDGRVLREGVIYFEEGNGVNFEEGYWLPASMVEGGTDV